MGLIIYLSLVGVELNASAVQERRDQFVIRDLVSKRLHLRFCCSEEKDFHRTFHHRHRPSYSWSSATSSKTTTTTIREISSHKLHKNWHNRDGVGRQVGHFGHKSSWTDLRGDWPRISSSSAVMSWAPVVILIRAHQYFATTGSGSGRRWDEMSSGSANKGLVVGHVHRTWLRLRHLSQLMTKRLLYFWDTHQPRWSWAWARV